MPPVEREIKFKETLRELLEQNRATVTHKKLGSSIGASSTTISHYVNGRIKPSFDALVGLAAFFNVTLDYLVFGERPSTQEVEDTQSVRAEVARALAESNGYQGRQRDLILRVTRRLVSEVERVAEDLMVDPENFGPAGFLTDSEAMAIETCSHATKVMIRTAPADVTIDAAGNISLGTYFPTLVDNLRAGRAYQFIFYGKRAKFTPIVQAYRDLLGRADIVPGGVHGNLEFRVLDAELPIAAVIHEIDTAQFERREPVLWERFRDNGIFGGTLVYMAMRHQEALGGVVLYDTYFDSALRMFRRDWEAARPL
ncbi:MAG TPA: helix-turn-helix transcriptional regulator [Thermoleophilia bacterium]|nr:helix-turn-helix transcriptional regulator [Thermoleophilia bacterium]